MKNLGFVVTAALVVAGCASFGPDEIYLPKLPTPAPGTEPIRLTGSVSGTLVVDRGCVKLRQANGGRLLTVLWHHETELASPPRTGLINRHTGRLYPFGTTVGLGGGYLSEERAKVLYPVAAERCGGPFATGWFPE